MDHALHDRHLMRHVPFDPKELERITGIKNWDTDFTHCEIEFKDPLYAKTLTFIQEFKDDVQENDSGGFNHSYRATYYKVKSPLESLLGWKEETEEEVERRKSDLEKNKKRGMYTYNKFSPGLGFFRFTHEGVTFFALHQAMGPPTGDDLKVHRTLLLFVRGRGKSDVMQALLDSIYEHTKLAEQPDQFNIYRYNARFRQWVYSHKAFGRTVESVVLPEETKDKIFNDLDIFLSDEERKWYVGHGIPYKRSYLFYGVPGSGKTSLISVIANLHDRAVCYLTPTDEYMSDDALRHSIQNLPEKAIVILEDIDALFAGDRTTKTKNTLTFSGLLNALDGVGSGLGQVFILSTNHREKLDSALTRNGRVDLPIEFDYIKPAQAAQMFANFYKDSTAEQQKKFADNMVKGLDRKQISAATLQHFFIKFRRKTAEEAVANIAKEIKEIVSQHETESDKQEKAMIYV